MRRVALKIAYLGRDYYGFQRQPGLKTVEGELLSGLDEASLVEDVDKCGFGIAGRTDRGVNALGNVISFLSREGVRINQINNSLPPSIRILAQAKVPLQFKARYALQRHYRYIWPLLTDDINFDAMERVAEHFIGSHDFSNFSKRSERNPVRTIDKLEIKKGKDHIQIDVFGESFLWNMVRKIVSILLIVGKGDLKKYKLENYFNPNIDLAIRPMPPEGLTLMDVTYSGIIFQEDQYAKNSFYSYLNQEYIKNQTIALSERDMLKNLKL
jgi:tRNA pseudouridine38-40 synthase